MFCCLSIFDPLALSLDASSLEKERDLTMEVLREIVPFFVGLVLPPVIMLLSRFFPLKQVNAPLSFVLSILVGCCVSFFAGELVGDLPEVLMSIIIDTSLVYTGSQVTYHLLWKPLLSHRLSPQSTKAKSQLS
jgi:predicted membrane channel-forming protein YqfA (hemolysin III family)